MKKIVLTLICLVIFLSAPFTYYGCTSATSGYSFVTPWIDRSINITYESSVYEVLHTEGTGNTVLAKGTLTYTLDTEGESDYVLESRLEMVHTGLGGQDSQNADLAGKTDTVYSRLVFGGGVSNIMLPKKLVKELNYQTIPDASMRIECDYTDGAKITHNYNTEEGILEFDRKKVELSVFDNDQLLLLARSASVEVYKAGAIWSYNILSPVDTVFSGALTVYPINISLSQDTQNIIPHEDFSSEAHSITDAGETFIPAYKADFYINSSSGMSGMTKGPTFSAYYAQKPAYSPTGTTQSRLLVKYEQFDYDFLTGIAGSKTTYNILSVTNEKP